MKSDISSLSAKLHNLEAKLVDLNSFNSANPAASNSESAPSSSSGLTPHPKLWIVFRGRRTSLFTI